MLTALLIIYGLVGVTVAFYVGSRIGRHFPDYQPTASAAWVIAVGIIVVSAFAGAIWPIIVTALELQKVENRSAE